MTETLNFFKALKAQLDLLPKYNENICAEIVVLCRVVATLSSNRGELSKVKIPELKSLSGARSDIGKLHLGYGIVLYFNMGA